MPRRLPTSLGLGLIALASVTGLALLVITTQSVDGGMLWPEVTKALVSILTVALIGGTVKYLFDQHVHERDARQQEVEFVRSAISEAESIQSDLDRARTLMMAHQSARIYRDQMQAMIGLRVRVESLSRSVTTHWEGQEQHRDDVTHISDRQSQISTDLTDLICEYQDNYRRVSDAQRIDEAEAAAAIEAYVQERFSGAHVSRDRPVLARRAWQLLSDPHEFPRLHDLRRQGEGSHYPALAENCTQTVGALTAIKARILDGKAAR